MTSERPGALDVSRETLERLTLYEALLGKWSARINLVGAATLADARSRHFLDSAQLFDHAPIRDGRWVDLGSGAGFPGLVCAILAAEKAPALRVTLVESDQRKGAFLRAVARETEVPVTVLAKRIETLPPLAADVLTARALADLSTLLTFAERHLAPGGVALFPKGKSWGKEVAAARKSWKFDLETRKSGTEAGAVVLKIKGVARV